MYFILFFKLFITAILICNLFNDSLRAFYELWEIWGNMPVNPNNISQSLSKVFLYSPSIVLNC